MLSQIVVHCAKTLTWDTNRQQRILVESLPDGVESRERENRSLLLSRSRMFGVLGVGSTLSPTPHRLIWNPDDIMLLP